MEVPALIVSLVISITKSTVWHNLLIRWVDHWTKCTQFVSRTNSSITSQPSRLVEGALPQHQGQVLHIGFYQAWPWTIGVPYWLLYPCKSLNVTDTILWQSHHDRVMQLNWLYFWDKCQMMPLKVWPHTALGCNHQSICMSQLQPLCSAALVPNVLPRRDEGSGKPCTVIDA